VTRILYVEDNDDNVYMLKLRLELLEDFGTRLGGRPCSGLYLFARISVGRVQMLTSISARCS
jgi:hypothetical protein